MSRGVAQPDKPFKAIAGPWSNKAERPDPVLHAQQFAAHVQNIEHQYKNAAPETVRAGKEWYSQAHDFAGEAGKHLGVSQEHASGMVAALSPGQPWGLNKAMTKQMGSVTTSHVRALQAGDRSGLAGTPLNKQSTDNIVKAHRIREGEKPEAVLPMDKKSGNFHKNIWTPDDPVPVTVDTHAHDVATQQHLPYNTDRGLQAAGRYAHFAGAYRAASQNLGVEKAHQVQATIWTDWRSKKKGSFIHPREQAMESAKWSDL